MLVITLVGSKAGEVVNLPPLSARAMLADGRARPVLFDGGEPSAVPVVADRVASREDRGMPRGKKRATR